MAVSLEFPLADMDGMNECMKDWFSACDSPSDMDLCTAQESMSCSAAAPSSLFDTKLAPVTSDMDLFAPLPKFEASALDEMLFVPSSDSPTFQLSPPASPKHLMEFPTDDAVPLPFTPGSLMACNDDNDLSEMLSFVDQMSSATDSDDSSASPLPKMTKRVRRTAKPKATAPKRSSPYTVPSKAKASATPVVPAQPVEVAPVAPAAVLDDFDDSKPGEHNKRDSHNVSERLRRLDLKKSFNTLRTFVPAIADTPRVHTGAILRHTIEYVQQLQEDDARIDHELAALRAENARLLAARQ